MTVSCRVDIVLVNSASAVVVKKVRRGEVLTGNGYAAFGTLPRMAFLRAVLLIKSNRTNASTFPENETVNCANKSVTSAPSLVTVLSVASPTESIRTISMKRMGNSEATDRLRR